MGSNILEFACVLYPPADSSCSSPITSTLSRAGVFEWFPVFLMAGLLYHPPEQASPVSHCPPYVRSYLSLSYLTYHIRWLSLTQLITRLANPSQLVTNSSPISSTTHLLSRLVWRISFGLNAAHARVHRETPFA